VIDADRLAAEVQPIQSRVEHPRLGAARRCEDGAGDADRPGAHDEDSLTGCDFAFFAAEMLAC
jgi:hypothetical protein